MQWALESLSSAEPFSKLQMHVCNCPQNLYHTALGTQSYLFSCCSELPPHWMRAAPSSQDSWLASGLILYSYPSLIPKLICQQILGDSIAGY